MKELKGFEGLYWIYPNGQILTKSHYGHKGKEAFLKPATDKKGYQRVGLMKDGKLITKKVHRLVAENFIPNPNNLPSVNHINSIKHDNRVENLEWSTQKEHNYNTETEKRQTNRARSVICFDSKITMPAFELKIFWCFIHIRKIHFFI